ncbi:DUF413 domain-containing protein [Vibrio mediterranei]|uniref:DUF413 domain-containing protein n=1 Tax=Vibrio mediterranei TaxID=689 RepID=UPI004069663F
MTSTSIRQGNVRFYDNVKFPRGFAKSGDFTLAEEEILTFYGKTLLGLESGELEATNDEEKRLIKVTQMELAPESKIEKTWFKYISLARGRKKFHTLNGRNKPEASDDYVADTLEDD